MRLLAAISVITIKCDLLSNIQYKLLKGLKRASLDHLGQLVYIALHLILTAQTNNLHKDLDQIRLGLGYAVSQVQKLL
ncbi:hypothetical protein D3C76_1568940 [compost metagenome]